MIALLLLVIFCTGDVRVSADSCLNDIVSNDTKNMYIDQVTLVYFIGNENITKPLINASQIVTDSRFNKSSPCVVYMHGFQAALNQSSTQKIITAYKNKPDIRVMIIDWAHLASQDYFTCIATLPMLGLKIAKAMDDLMDKGLILNGLVGHSLGAHGSGYICRNMNHTCKSIVALDPAGPFFTKPPCNSLLNKADADCVSVLHTNGALFGTIVQLGTSDFYANGGLFQPGCPIDAIPTNITKSLQDGSLSPGCSHSRAVSIWAEEVSDPDSFQGRQCGSGLFGPIRCRNGIILNLGECDSTSPASYYFSTNSGPPYGRGTRGY